MLSLEFHKPSARQVQDRQCNYPHEINERQTVAVVRGLLLEKESSMPKPRCRLVINPSHENRHGMNQVDVHHVIKHRYPAVRQQETSKLLFYFCIVEPHQ